MSNITSELTIIETFAIFSQVQDILTYPSPQKPLEKLQSESLTQLTEAMLQVLLTCLFMMQQAALLR